MLTIDKKIEELWESNHPSASRSYPITRVAYEEERARLRAAARKSIDYTLDALQLVFANLISKIADVNIIIGPSYGHKPQSSSSSSFTDRQDNNKKRKFDRQQGSTPRVSQQKVEPQDSTACPGCGYVRKFRDGKPYCPGVMAPGAHSTRDVKSVQTHGPPPLLEKLGLPKVRNFYLRTSA